MQVQVVGFPQIIHDNERTYFNYVEGIISSIDPTVAIQFTKRFQGIGVRICPSTYQYFDPILSRIKKFHKQLGINVDFSKSMKTGSNINFFINFGQS